MFKVYRTRRNNNLYDYYLCDGKNKLAISYVENLDLLFYTFTTEKEMTFFITKENMFIYNLFCNLFIDLDEVNIYKETLLECNNINKINELDYKIQKLKNNETYKKLFQDKTITWISDSSITDNDPFVDTLIIKKKKDCLELKFTFYSDNISNIRSIRINNSRSKYAPFNILFMKLFDELQNYDPNYHQIHIEEYLHNNELKKLIKK